MTDRLLLGPGPSPVSPPVLAALGAPPRSHLDPDLMEIMDDVRARLTRVFHASHESFTFAVSGTGTSGMEAVVANLAAPGKRAVVVVNGYFGARLADALTRCGCEVVRVEGEWGRAIDVEAVTRALTTPTDIVAIVHAETSTGVRNPVEQVAALARERDALTIVDAVTSLGAMPVDVSAWGIDACFSCTQKGLGAPSGMAPVTFAPRALERLVPCRSFYFDLALLQDYWLRRKYHHTISAPLVYALDLALEEVEDEGLATRWQRHERNHLALADGLGSIGLALLPPTSERLWSLNAVRVPDGVDELVVRKHLLTDHQIEIGAGLGPLAGKIWRVGLMGSGSTAENVKLVVAALGDALGRV